MSCNRAEKAVPSNRLGSDDLDGPDGSATRQPMGRQVYNQVIGGRTLIEFAVKLPVISLSCKRLLCFGSFKRLSENASIIDALIVVAEFVNGLSI